MAPSKKAPRKSTTIKLRDLKRKSVKESVAARVQGGTSKVWDYIKANKLQDKAQK